MPSLAATTHPLATTHSHSHSLSGLITIAVVALVIITAGYLLTCWLFPFATCHHTTLRRAYRCRHCDGTGYRLRTGRRLLSHLRNTRRHH